MGFHLLSSLFCKEDKFRAHILPYLTRRARRKALSLVRQKYPELFKGVDEDVTCRHKELWSKLCGDCVDDWLRFLSNISGIVDYRYVPHDLYVAYIDPVLNDYKRRDLECEDKNLLDMFVDLRYTPRCLVRYMRGMFMDGGYNWLSPSEVNQILSLNHGDCIGKVCTGSLGGHGVICWKYDNGRYVSGECELSAEFIQGIGCESYVVQERVSQCEFSAQFNPSSANTFRMITLRCPWNGEVVLLRSGMRIGVTDAAIDNLSAGGICVVVDDCGNLSKTGYSWIMKYGFNRYKEHPTSHIPFEGKRHPYFEKMKSVVLSLAAKIPNMNLLGWDVMVDSNGEVKILEVNATCIGTDWVQYDFGPLFGKYTDDVVAWCANHRELASNVV